MSYLRLVALIAFSSFVVGTLLWWSAGANAPIVAPTVGELTFGGPFTLTDKNNKPFTDRDLHGRYSLIFFGFTGCAAICPTTLQTMTLMMSELGPSSEALQPVFISIDPDRDTPEVLRQYISAFDDRIVGLTGTREQIAVVARAYHAHYRIVLDKENGSQFEHTTALYLMDRDGKYVTHIPPDVSPRKMADLVRARISPTADRDQRTQ